MLFLGRGHEDLYLKSFCDYLVSFNICSQYVYLVKEVSKPISLDSFFFFLKICLTLTLPHQHCPPPPSHPQVFISGLGADPTPFRPFPAADSCSVP